MLFLLPTIGIHVDITHCGSIERVGLAHDVNVNITACCESTGATSGCSSDQEIAKAPEYADYNIVSGLDASNCPAFTLAHSLSSDHVHSIKWDNPISYIKSLKGRHQSLLQVFLC